MDAYKKKNKTPKEQFEYLLNLARDAQATVIEPEYLGHKIKHRLRCKNNHEWNTTPAALSRGHECGQCYRGGLRTVEHLHTCAKKLGLECISERNESAPMDFSCRCGMTITRWACDIFEGKGCYFCTDAIPPNNAKERLRYLEFKLAARGALLLDKEYRGNKEKINIQCNQGHHFSCSFNKLFSAKSWCPQCLNRQRQFEAQPLMKHVQSKRGVLLSQMPSAWDQLCTFMCEKGHTWNAKAGAVRDKKSWCPTCSKYSRGDPVDMQRVLECCARRGGVCLTPQINSRTDPILCRCAQGHEWTTTGFSLVYMQSWCHTCAGSNGERWTLEFLERLTGKTFRKVKPHWLVNPITNHRMELDGYNQELNIAVEYQGEQHYTFIPGWHKTLDEFKRSQQRDLTKRALCEQNGVALFTVPFIKKPTQDKVQAHVEWQIQAQGISVLLPYLQAWKAAPVQRS